MTNTYVYIYIYIYIYIYRPLRGLWVLKLYRGREMARLASRSFANLMAWIGYYHYHHHYMMELLYYATIYYTIS